MRKRRIVWMILCAILIVALGYGGLELSRSRTFQFFGGLTSRVVTEEKVVALTFDDAPTGTTTDEVLRILAEKHVPATFYVIGEHAEQYPEQLRAIIDAGYEVGNHSYSHHRMVFKTQAFIASEIKRTDALLRNAGYEGEITFRPPNGKKVLGLPWYLSRQGMRTVMWDVEPDTYVSGDANAIVDYTVHAVRPGSIILLHPFCDGVCAADREALPHIIDELTSRGYRFVTMHEMLPSVHYR